jgi:hypothetical protein
LGCSSALSQASRTSEWSSPPLISTYSCPIKVHFWRDVILKAELRLWSYGMWCYVLWETCTSVPSEWYMSACGSVVVETLYYKPEGRRFKTLWCEWIFSIYLILLAALGPGSYSATNRNEYQKQENNVAGE